MKDQIARLQTVTAELGERMTRVEANMEFGSKRFANVDAAIKSNHDAIDLMHGDIKSHMEKEQGFRVKFLFWIMTSLLAAVLGLVGYVWNLNVAGTVLY